MVLNSTVIVPWKLSRAKLYWSLSQHPFTGSWCSLLSRKLKVAKNNAKSIVLILARPENSQSKDSLNPEFALLVFIIVFLTSLTRLVLPLSSDGNCLRMVQLGVIHQLLDLLEKHVQSEDTSVQQAALSALQNLAIPGTEPEDNWLTLILCKDGSSVQLCATHQCQSLVFWGAIDLFPLPCMNTYLNNSSGLPHLHLSLSFIKYHKG